jgi:PAS domain S-box-containing protein
LETPASSPDKSTVARYGLAVLAAVVALLLRDMLSPLLGVTNPYHTAWAAVVFAAWYCGLGPSIVTTLLTLLGIWYWFLSPSGSFRLEDPRSQLSAVAGFLILSAFIIALGEANRRSKARFEREMQDRLRAEHEFQALANSLPELCWMANADGDFFWYNERWYEYTGTSFSQMEGRGWQSVHDPAILPSVMERWNGSLATGQPFEMEFPLRGADGVFRWFLTRIRPVRDAEGKVVRWFGVNTDIHQQRELRQTLIESRHELEKRVQERTTDLELLNHNLSQLSARLIQLQDEERRRIARELHDSVGQMLAAIKMNIAVVQSTPLDPHAAAAAAENSQLVDDITREIRTMSHLLHPPLLDEVGLSSAIEWYVSGFSERSKIAVHLEIASDLGRLGYDLEIAIFRIVQECLTNVHRHSGSRSAAVRLSREDSRVRVEIHDTGKGIPLEKQQDLIASAKLGVGVRGMRERLTQLGGKLQVQSDKTGTTVRAEVPLRKNNGNQEVA